MAEGDGNGRTGAAAIVGFWMAVSAAVLGWLLADGVAQIKEYERTVEVKGLAEREVPADVVIWPIAFTAVANDLGELYETLGRQTATVREFLVAHDVAEDAITVAPPAVTDKLAQQYGGGPRAEFRYVAQQTVTVYSNDVPTVRRAIAESAALGRRGLVLSGQGYGGGTEYLFTGLNDVKPVMIEEATRKAREVAAKFAADSDSRLGKIRRARQGQFSITDRDKNNPHIKKIRVVSTIEYQLSD
jgi:hypothetical protein